MFANIQDMPLFWYNMNACTSLIEILFPFSMRWKRELQKPYSECKVLVTYFFRIRNVYSTEEFRIRTYFTVKENLINHTQS